MLASISVCRETHIDNMIPTAALSQVHMHEDALKIMSATSSVKRMEVHTLYACHGCIERICL